MKKTDFIVRMIVVAIFSAMMFSSCTVLKPYQKAFVNDTDMQLGDKTINSFDDNFKTYREGVSGANGSKSGGGCGCN